MTLRPWKGERYVAVLSFEPDVGMVGIGVVARFVPYPSLSSYY